MTTEERAVPIINPRLFYAFALMALIDAQAAQGMTMQQTMPPACHAACVDDIACAVTPLHTPNSDTPSCLPKQ